MKLKPLHDNVVLKPISAEDTTKSGIFLPETADKERPERGEVVAVGPGKRTKNGEIIPVSVKIGDKVMFKKYSPDEIKIGDEEYLLVGENDILAVLE